MIGGKGGTKVTAVRDLNSLRVFIAHAPAAMAMFDSDMRYVAASRRWLSDYGLGDRDLRGESHYEVFPDIPERWRSLHRRGLEGEVITAMADRFDRADGTVQWLRWEIQPWSDPEGHSGIIIFTEDITARQRAMEDIARLNAELEATVADLRRALKEIKTLQGILPICAYCKDIRNDAGLWQPWQSYLRDHSDTQFSHGICPRCEAEHLGGIAGRP